MKIKNSPRQSILKTLIGGALLLGVCALGPPQAAPASGSTEDSFLQSRLQQGGNLVAPDAYDRAVEQWQRLPKAGPPAPGRLTAASVSGVNGTVWKPIGPSPLKLDSGFVNGRVHAIAVNPNNPKVIYQGVNIGGVWKTIDAGKTWTPLWDQQPSLGVGQP